MCRHIDREEKVMKRNNAIAEKCGSCLQRTIKDRVRNREEKELKKKHCIVVRTIGTKGVDMRNRTKGNGLRRWSVLSVLAFAVQSQYGHV